MKKRKISTPVILILLAAVGLLTGTAAALAANAGLLPWVQTSGETTDDMGTASVIRTADSAAEGNDDDTESTCKADGTILYKGVEYTARSKEIAEEQVGELLISLSMESQDGEDQEAESTGVALYKIENISVICAVAVQYEGTDTWHPAVNTSYCPETLGQFVEDMDLTNTLPIDSICYDEETDTESWGYMGPADDETIEKVLELLTSSPDAKNEPGLDHEPTAAYASTLTSLPLLGYENEYLRGYVEIDVYDDGYLMICIQALGEQYFDIGEDTAQEFIQYVKQIAEEANNE